MPPFPGFTPARAMRLAFLVLAAGLAATATALCRLSIPDSGGASQRPASFASASVTAMSIAPDTVVPGEGEGAPPVGDSCAGPEGCARECCQRDNCLAWSWIVAGSVHAACGANTCEIFEAAPQSDWAALKATATLYGGYNVAGYVFDSAREKIACCVSGAPPPAEVGCVSGAPASAAPAPASA